MKYALRQKLVSFGSNFTIEAENGARYEIKGEPITILDKLSFQDSEGTELAFIALQVERWRGFYEIQRNGRLIASVRRDTRAWFPRHRFFIEMGDDNLEATGDALDLEFTIKRGQRQIARYTKQWFHFSDTWGIEIDDNEADHLLLLAVGVILARARERLWSSNS